MIKHLMYFICILMMNACIIETKNEANHVEQNNSVKHYELTLTHLTSELITNDISILTENKVASINIKYDTVPFDGFKMGLPASIATLSLFEEIIEYEDVDSIHANVRVNSLPDSVKVRYSIEDLNSCQKYLVKLDEFTELFNNENWRGIKQYFKFNQDQDYVDELIENYIKEQRHLFGEFDGGNIEGCFFTKEIVALYLHPNNQKGYSCYLTLILDKKTASPIELGFNDLSLIR